MSSEYIGIETARKTLGDLVTAVQQGTDVVLTRNGKPAARLIAYKESTVTEHFTAWLTTDSTALDQGCADVVVLADQNIGDDETPEWSSTRNPLMHAVTTVDAREGNPDDAMREAEDLLHAHGWRTSGEWSGVPTGYVITVERD